jgi:hypothetical protein
VGWRCACRAHCSESKPHGAAGSTRHSLAGIPDARLGCVQQGGCSVVRSSGRRLCLLPATPCAHPQPHTHRHSQAHLSGASCSALKASVMSRAGRRKADSSVVPLKWRSFLAAAGTKGGAGRGERATANADGGRWADPSRRQLCNDGPRAPFLRAWAAYSLRVPAACRLFCRHQVVNRSCTVHRQGGPPTPTCGCSPQRRRSPRRPWRCATPRRPACGPPQTG